MAFDHSVMIGEIEAIIADTWPEVLGDNDGGGIFDMEQIRRLPFEDLSTPAAGGALPFAVYDLSPSTDEDWGITNDAQGADLIVTYVAREALTNLTVRAKGQALKSALFAATFTGMSILRLAGESADLNPVLDWFLTRYAPYTAGAITMRIVYGESAL